MHFWMFVGAYLKAYTAKKMQKTTPPVYVFKLASSFLILHKAQLDDETIDV